VTSQPVHAVAVVAWRFLPLRRQRRSITVPVGQDDAGLIPASFGDERHG
jgi:hypothetical protein